VVPNGHARVIPNAWCTSPRRARIDRQRSHRRGDSRVVNEAFARRYVKGPTPIGAEVSWRNWKTLHIVGVVADTKIRLDEESGPALYLPLDDGATFNLPSRVVRSNVQPGALDSRRSTDRQPNRFAIATMTIGEMIAHTSASPRLCRLSLWCAIIALVLAATGLYGVLAYSVRARTQEFGIRMALGADAGRVYGDVMRQGIVLTVAGVVPGLAGSYYGSPSWRTSYSV
jgi:hypothetical protein